MTVTFGAELHGSSTRSGGAIRRRGKIFEVGNFPDKSFSLSVNEARSACEKFTPCEIDIEHGQTLLSGKLVSVEFGADQKTIYGTVEEPAPLAALLVDTPRRVSLGWDRARKRIVSLAYVISPRISDAQQVTAADELKAAQKAFARGKADVEAVTTSQAKLSGIAGALGFLDEEITEKQIEYSQAVAAEMRAAQLEQLKAKVETANQSWDEYGKAQPASLRAIEYATKSLLQVFIQHDNNFTDVTNFLNEQNTVVTLSDLDINTDGATQKLAFVGASASGTMPDDENYHYLEVLRRLIEIVWTCRDSMRPCPPAP